MVPLCRTEARLQEIQEKVAALKKKHIDSMNLRDRLRQEAEGLAEKLSRAEEVGHSSTMVLLLLLLLSGILPLGGLYSMPRPARFVLLVLTFRSQLVEGLSGERQRWERDASVYEEQAGMLIGDVLLASAFLSYAGSFTSEYRQELLESWKQVCLLLIAHQYVLSMSEEQELNSLLLPLVVFSLVLRDWMRLGRASWNRPSLSARDFVSPLLWPSRLKSASGIFGGFPRMISALKMV